MPTNTPQPVYVTEEIIITRPPKVVVITATPTITSRPTITPTSTPTPTITPSPTQTPTPTLTAIPKFVWKSNFESGFRGWDWNSPGKQQGGKAYIISDPTNSEHGLVMKAEIGNGDKPTVLDWDFKWMVYRIYPFVSFPFKPAPCEIREDVWLSKDLLASVLDRGALVIGPDVFNKTDQYGGEWSSVIQAKIDHHSKHNSKIYLFLETHVGHYPIPVVDFPEFTPETWHTVSIFLNSDGHIQLRLNSQLVSETQLPSGQRIGTVGGHPGLYAGYRKNSLPLEGYMLIDNYEIRCW